MTYFLDSLGTSNMSETDLIGKQCEHGTILGGGITEMLMVKKITSNKVDYHYNQILHVLKVYFANISVRSS